MIHIAQSGNGQPIILLHGFCENHHIWDNITTRLSSKYRPLAIDLPGFGLSDPLPEKCNSLDDVADAIAEVLSKQNLGRAFVVGHSLGGYVALALVDLYPNLFQGVALVNSTTYSDSVDKKRTRDKVIAFISRQGVAPFVNQFVEGIFYQKDNFPEAFNTVKSMGISCTQEVLVRYTAMMRDRPDRTFLLEKPVPPVMVIAGKEDDIIPVGQSREMLDYLPEERGVLLECCGHMAMYEQPEELYNSLIGFMDQKSMAYR